MIKHIDLNTFTRDDSFYGTIDLLLTIKSFDLLAIRKRYLASRRRNVSGKAGSIERRPVATGGIAAMTIRDGKCTRTQVIKKMPEPRAIDVVAENGIFGFAAENTVYIFENAQKTILNSPWFSYIHTIQFSPWHPDRVLIASSGLDCIFEYDFRTHQPTFEWFAWENGFAEAHDPETNQPVILTRKPEVADTLKAEGRAHLLITDPAKQVLPTAKRAAFINSVCYDPKNPNGIIATFFHEGAVFTIDRSSGKAIKVLDGLKNPHGGRRCGHVFMGTSTAGGQVIIGDMDTKHRYDFQKLDGKPSEIAELEWIQNTITHNGILISIDSNRANLTMIDPEKRRISQIPVDPDWAIQDLVEGRLTAYQEKNIKAL